MTIDLLICNIVAVVGSLVGMMFIAHKNKLGFIIFFGVELSMAYIGYSTYQYGLIAQSCIYFLANIYSIYRWSLIK